MSKFQKYACLAAAFASMGLAFNSLTVRFPFFEYLWLASGVGCIFFSFLAAKNFKKSKKGIVNNS